MDFDPNWTDEEFLVAVITDAVHGFSLADHLGDAMDDAIGLAALEEPTRYADYQVGSDPVTPRERCERYRRIVTPIMAKLPCFARWHEEPMDEDEADCRSEVWDGEKCPTCQARERVQQQESSG